MKISHRITRLTKFEYWPYWFFYFPFTLQWLYYSIRSVNLLYFTRVNYSTKFGGFFQYSKNSLTQGIDQQYLPDTRLYSSKKALLDDSENPIFRNDFICKPDVGERGKGVERYSSFTDLEKSIDNIDFPCLVQQFIDLPVELGILFYRFPSGKKGITSIVSKEFLTVNGDGSTRLNQLIEQEIRASNRMEYLQKKFEPMWNEVLPKGKELLLEEIGNHCRGTTFYDSRNLITPELVDLMDKITKNISGFHYGRIDLKCRSVEELYKGEHIKVIEVNGVNSEANHIYDPNMRLIDAYKSVYQNLKIVFKISKELKKAGIEAPQNVFQFIAAWLRHVGLRA